MSYASNVLFHASFDANPLSNAVTSTFFNVFGTTPVIETGVFGNAWRMSDTVYIDSNDLASLTNKLTVGFWLKSVNPGVATNPSHVAIPLKMPVVAKSAFVIGSSVVGYSSTAFNIWEETQDDGRNVMKFRVDGFKIGIVSATLTSSPYAAGVYHHFWLVCDCVAAKLRLFVDTFEDLGATTSGTLPTTFTVTFAKISVNNNTFGNKYEIVRNKGAIDDLVIFSDAIVSPTSIVRAANDGALYIADTAYQNLDEVDQPAVFDDPGTAQINSVHGNRGRVYVGRSDGKLLRGTKLIWQSRREFGNPKEAKNLITISKGHAGSVTAADGSLKIQDKIVRV